MIMRELELLFLLNDLSYSYLSASPASGATSAKWVAVERSFNTVYNVISRCALTMKWEMLKWNKIKSLAHFYMKICFALRI